MLTSYMSGPLVQRILARRLEYEERNQKKEEKEKAAFEAHMKSQNGNTTN